MKSSNEDLRKRGFITIEDIDKYKQCSNSELTLLINSKSSTERSVAINLLSNRYHTENLDFVKILLERLCIEKCLYTKIEICKALEKGKVKTAEEMVVYLGRIGKNQHKSLPEKVSQKKSYPLPRDIIARSLARMDCRILPVLFNVLNSNDEVKISEVIDAIGFSLFYNPNYVNEDFLQSIISTLNKYSENDLIVWKCLTCLSSFKSQECIEVLKQFINSSKNELLRCEAERSLKLN